MNKVFMSLGQMYRKPRYVVLSVLLFIVVGVVSVLLPSLSLIKQFVGSSNVSIGEKIAFVWNSLGLFVTNMNLGSELVMIGIAILFAIQLSFTVYYFRIKKVFSNKNNGVGIAGILSGILGIGCASCGSVLLSSIIGVSATTGFLGILPFGGYEFGIVAIILLLISIVVIGRKLQQPDTCKV